MVTDSTHVKGNYLQIHENLMDITHFQYLHGAALGTRNTQSPKSRSR